ncbi:MAG: phosphate ABC transporter permease PstA [Spirochaetaceae bacterium]
MALQTVETPAPPEPHLPSPHSRRVRWTERIAKGFIWSAAGVTILILGLIVGYIVVNGFYTRSVRAEPTVPFPQEAVDTGRGADFAVVAPRGLRLDSLQYDELREVFLGLNPYLGYLTGQDRNATPVVAGDAGFRDAVADYLLGRDGRFGEAVRRAAGPEEVSRIIAESDGAVALVPAGWRDDLTRVRTVLVHEVSVAVHPDVTALQAGRRLNRLNRDQLRTLVSGEAAAWEEVGGPRIEVSPADLSAGNRGAYEPLPVRPVVFTGDGEVAAKQQRLIAEVFPESSPGAVAGAISVDSPEEFVDVIRTTAGAFGLVSRDIVREFDLQAVEVQHVEQSLNLRPSFFVTPPRRAGAVGGASTIILNTLAMIAFVLAIATPIGVAGAIYLVEYARQGRLLTILRIGTDTLAGIPSIVFGLFGLVFFAQFLGFQTGLVSGTLTLTLMILPTVVRTSEEALRAVPKEIREGSLALGATKLQTIFRVVLPSAAPGILTGMILGIGRAVGETAALLYTMGSNLALIRSLNSPIRVLSVHLYLLVRETISLPNAFAAATILVIIVIVVNYLTRTLIGRMSRMAAQ